MDFDDLDDALDERVAAGDVEGIEGMTFSKKELKKFKGKLPKITANQKSLVTYDIGSKDNLSMRAFVFYGPGDTAKKLEDAGVPYMFNNDCSRVELAVYEWPGHGARSGEAMADNVDALVQDAFETIKPSLEQVKEGAEFEGAPFAFIGRSVGCQVMSGVAKKVIMNYGLAPCAAIVMNRAPLQFPLLSEAGQKVLEATPEKVVEALNFKAFAGMDKGAIGQMAKDYRYANEVCEPLYHKYECDLLLLKSMSDKVMDEKGRKGSKFKVTTIKIKGSAESLTLPVSGKTTCNELLTVVKNMFAYTRTAKLSAFDVNDTRMDGIDPVKSVMTIDGLEDFKHPRYTWPSPVCVIGAGFFGVKMVMQYHHQKNYNVVLFDRLKSAGGYAWHLSATKHSRVQTDFGAFNIWFGHEYNYSGEGGFGTEKGGRSQFAKPFKGPGSPMGGTMASGAGTDMDANPVRHQVLAQLNYALKEYGGDECARFETEVSSLKIIGDPDWEGRHYKLGLRDLSKAPVMAESSKASNAWADLDKPAGTEIQEDCKVSVIYHFPGAYDLNRIVDYPGEDKFGGQIGYGMGSGHGGLFVWDDGNMKGKRAAVLGNGAFAVENVRSCIEGYCSKVYIITRRKSLLCPRMPCWFCHQGPVPTPAPLLLDIFKPMYEAAGIEDPWDFYAVAGANEKKTVCAIKQSSRFGIGDIAFLAHAVGIFEYRVGVVERFSHQTIHLSTGEKLEKMHHVCKALGLIGDPRVDQLHAMTHKLGPFVNGDWRRCMSADPTGMDAMRFATFSGGPAACSQAKQWYHLHNHPWEYREARANSNWDMIPKHEMSKTQPDQTIYMTTSSYEMQSGNVFGSCWMKSYMSAGDEATYKWCLVQTMHPTKEYLEYCKADWDRYQKLIKENCPGFEDAKDVPYPYTLGMVDEWCERYNRDCKYFQPITAAGPSEDTKKSCIDSHKAMEEQWRQDLIKPLFKEYKLLPDAGEDPIEEAEACTIYQLKKGLTDTAADSAMDFSDAQLEAWKDCVSDDSKFLQESCNTGGETLLTSQESWQKISGFIKGKM